MKDLENISALMRDIGRRAKAASQELAFASAEQKFTALELAADELRNFGYAGGLRWTGLRTVALCFNNLE